MPSEYQKASVAVKVVLMKLLVFCMNTAWAFVVDTKTYKDSSKVGSGWNFWRVSSMYLVKLSAMRLVASTEERKCA